MAKPEKPRRPRDEEESPRSSRRERDGGRRVVKSARERAEKRALEGGSSFLNLPQGVKFLKIKQECTLTLSVIPYEAKVTSKFAKKGDIVSERTYHMHRNIGPDEERVICPKTTVGSNHPCPICEYRAKLAKRPNADEKTLKDLAPQERQLFRVINRKDRDAGIQIFDMSYFCFGKLLDERIRSDEEGFGWEKYASLDTDGFDLRVTFSEKSMGKNTTFFYASSIDFVPRTKALPDSLIDEGPNLDEILRVESYDTLRKMLLQTPDDDDGKDEEEEEEEDGDEDARPAKKKSKKPVEDEDEDEEDADSEDEDSDEESDDEDEAPAPKKKAKKPAPVEDDEEDDEDWDEEPAPAKKKSKNR